MTGSPANRIRRQLSLLALFALLSSGCAALTNPIVNGVPVRILPDELLAESREGLEPIPLTTLRQQPPEKYLLAAGDTLGVYIDGQRSGISRASTLDRVSISDSTRWDRFFALRAAG
jgi:hypothetical protein